MSTDVIEGLVTFLKADAPVAALAGTRVFGGELPPAESVSMPRKAVVLKPSGGPGFAPGSYAPLSAQRVDAFSYGETPFEAGRLSRAVSDALKALRREPGASMLIHSVEHAGGFASERDPDAAWPRIFQSFQALFDERATA